MSDILCSVLNLTRSKISDIVYKKSVLHKIYMKKKLAIIVAQLFQDRNLRKKFTK